MDRRTVLLGTGVAASAVLAGCASEGDENDENGSDDEDGAEAATDDGGDGTDGGNETDADGGGNESDGGSEDGESEDADIEERIEGEPPMEGLAITEHELVEDDFSVTVTGIVANETGEDLGPVEVGAVFYDADGEAIDDAVVRTAELADGEEWAFELMSVADGVAGYAVGIASAEPTDRSPV
ncbi:FxLYD domain-containing protein [Natronococcus jeotgali]|uniref:Uncharacterized protein n=1 Tax=Natronococcus jeotgali DSM 18795 TaxID=1227498 RepID=L9WRV2_9EURY|nr:FxLYD domain-containing protein [Natronococcus jeotgali]ELY52152.1 hypothetical protein C492_19851 [Natronococcus jeotgali DSM 18795]